MPSALQHLDQVLDTSSLGINGQGTRQISASFTQASLIYIQTEIGPCIQYKLQQLIIVQSRNWPGDDLLRDISSLVADMTP